MKFLIPLFILIACSYPFFLRYGLPKIKRLQTEYRHAKVREDCRRIHAEQAAIIAKKAAIPIVHFPVEELEKDWRAAIVASGNAVFWKMKHPSEEGVTEREGRMYNKIQRFGKYCSEHSNKDWWELLDTFKTDDFFADGPEWALRMNNLNKTYFADFFAKRGSTKKRWYACDIKNDAFRAKLDADKPRTGIDHLSVIQMAQDELLRRHAARQYKSGVKLPLQELPLTHKPYPIYY